MSHSFFNSLARSWYLSFFSFSFNFTLWSVHNLASFFCSLLQGLVVCPRLSDPFVSQNPKIVCASRSPGQILGFAYIDCSYGQISVSCMILVDHFAYYYTLSVLICCISLFCDWSWRFYHYITYICCIVVSYLFLLWYDWFLWGCFVLPLEQIQFLSWGFPFLATPTFSFVICRLLVA